MTAGIDRHELWQIVARADAAASDGAAARDELGATPDVTIAVTPSGNTAAFGRDPDSHYGRSGAERRTGGVLSRSGRPTFIGGTVTHHPVHCHDAGTAS